VGASSLYSLGVAFQAMDAREAPHEEHLRFALALGLVRRARWLFGTGLSMLGFPLQVVALMLAPLVVVQPAMAVGLLALMFMGERLLGERPGRYEYAAMGAILLGVLGAALCAPPQSTTTTAERATVALVLAGLAAASFLPYALRLVHRQWAGLTMVCAGLAFAWSGVATKLASDDLSNGRLGFALAWALSTAAASAVGMLSEMSSLQARPAIQVAPVVFVTQTVVPVALAPTLLGEHFTETPGGGWPLAFSLLVLLSGAAMLTRSPLLLGFMEARRDEIEPPREQDQRVSADSGSTATPSERSRATIRSNPSTDSGEPSTPTTTTSPARMGR
jgi:drug/metabolite transporter (DMT)-like permease